MELQVLLHAINMIENIIDNSGNDTLLVGVADDSLHRVRFTCACTCVKIIGNTTYKLVFLF